MMGVTYTTKHVKCRHCGKYLWLKQATDGSWISTQEIIPDLTANECAQKNGEQK